MDSNIDNAKLIEQSVSFLSRNGVRVIFDAEHFFDGYLQSEAFALDMLDAAVNGGADTLVLSLEIKTTFIKKIIPEPVFVLGNVIKAGKSIAFLEGKITDNQNNIKYDFSGKLPFSWPSKNSNNPLNIKQKEYYPLYKFGYGLTYQD